MFDSSEASSDTFAVQDSGYRSVAAKDALRVLMIDDTAYFRILVKTMLISILPDSTFNELDPLVEGKPGADFDWSQYDVLLLDYKLGEEDGLAWYREFSLSSHFPAVIMFTGEGSETLAVQAMKSGVDDYLPKSDLSPDRLKNALLDAVSAHRNKILDQSAKTLVASGDSPFEQIDSDFIEQSQIADFQIEKKLGSGASATAYLARSVESGERVVLKILNPQLKDKRDLLQRFMAEYNVIAGLDSRHIVKMHKRDLTADCCYLVMEYLPGGDLRQRIKNGMTPKDALKALAQLAIGMHEMHRNGIIHRDIKPENIMFRADGNLAIVDFGIARQLEHESGLTRHGEVYGTPHYIAPEQVFGEKADARSDLYSLGVIFYEMLTGDRPFKADSLYNLFYKQQKERPPKLTGKLSVFNPLIDRLIIADPDKRFNGAADLYREIKNRWAR